MTQVDHRARAAAGISVLQHWYRPQSGLWHGTGWWNAANALTAVIRYIRYTGDRGPLGVISTTFDRAQLRQPRFINRFFDDSLWWALAWVDAYDLTGDARYLSAAEAIFAYSRAGWDGRCGGGLWWNTDRRYKNAITNELFLTLAAALHQRSPGGGPGRLGRLARLGRSYLDWALRAWEWLHGSGMIGPSGLVSDGLTASCASNEGTTWTYNQGVLLGGLAALHAITGDPGYLRQAEFTADAALHWLSTDHGILAEPCEAAGCDGDQTQFKGIFVRYLHELCAATGSPAYRSFILANAASVWDNARSPAGEFGLRWAGPFDRGDASRQSCAVEVLTAAAALAGPSAG